MLFGFKDFYFIYIEKFFLDDIIIVIYRNLIGGWEFLIKRVVIME